MEPKSIKASKPIGLTVTPQKSARGRVEQYEAKQGREEWYGKTAQEALEKRERCIADACADSFQPIVFHLSDGSTMLGWRDLQGWRYGFARKENARRAESDFMAGGCSGGTSMKDRASTERAMRLHAAQIEIKIRYLSNGADPIVEDDGSVWLISNRCTNEDRRDHRQRVAWSLGCAVGKHRGLNEVDTRKLAEAYQQIERERGVVFSVEFSEVFRVAFGQAQP